MEVLQQPELPGGPGGVSFCWGLNSFLTDAAAVAEAQILLCQLLLWRDSQGDPPDSCSGKLQDKG